jgi:hypothetical protein
VAYRFHNTKHFVNRVDLRNLSTENIKNVINYPDTKQRAGEGKNGVRWIFVKCVDGASLKVVAEIKRNDCWIVTAYEI